MKASDRVTEAANKIVESGHSVEQIYAAIKKMSMPIALRGTATTEEVEHIANMTLAILMIKEKEKEKGA